MEMNTYINGLIDNVHKEAVKTTDIYASDYSAHIAEKAKLIYEKLVHYGVDASRASFAAKEYTQVASNKDLISKIQIESGYRLAQPSVVATQNPMVGLSEPDRIAKTKEIIDLAEQGDADAQFMLGGMCFSGNGILQDYVQAHKWFNIAGSNGHHDAMKQREAVSEKMTTPQIAEAQKLAREWSPKSK